MMALGDTQACCSEQRGRRALVGGAMVGDTCQAVWAPYSQHLSTEPLLHADAVLGAGDVRGLMFQ